MAQPYSTTFGDYELSSDPARLDLDRIESFLRASYWAAKRPREVIEKSIAGSLCMGAYQRADGQQLGFSRLVTDYATFGWLCDVFVDPAARGLASADWVELGLPRMPPCDRMRCLVVVSERVAQVAVRSMVAGVRPARPVCGRSVLYQASHLGRSAVRLSAER